MRTILKKLETQLLQIYPFRDEMGRGYYGHYSELK